MHGKFILSNFSNFSNFLVNSTCENNIERKKDNLYSDISNQQDKRLKVEVSKSVYMQGIEVSTIRLL